MARFTVRVYIQLGATRGCLRWTWRKLWQLLTEATPTALPPLPKPGHTGPIQVKQSEDRSGDKPEPGWEGRDESPAPASGP